VSVEVGLQPGDVVEGRYILLEELGRGPLFVVFRALQKRVNRHVILRAVAPAFKGNKGDSFFGDFEKEALLSSRLRHHNTVIFFDFGLTPEGTLYRVSEQLGGESLRVRLDREKILPLPQVVKIVRQIARSLGEAHSMGIVHAELRPESVILMNLQGEDDFVKVIAYGISALRAAVGLEPKNRPLVQTIVEAGLDPLSPGADVFGLGMIMYEMMVGLRPVMDGGTLKPPALPLQVESSLLGRVFRRATSYEAADRFEDGNAFLAALDGFEAQTEASRVVQVGRSAVNSKEMQALSRRDVEALDAQEPPRTNPGLRERKNPLEGEIGWRPPILSSSRRVRARRRVPIVGRRRERDDIMRVCAEVSGQRQGRVVLVGGGIGVGKTRLMR